MAEIVSTGRGTVKPAGALTVEKTGQYAALTGLWAFNETGEGASVNLADPGTGNATLQGSASIAADSVGSALSVGGSASQYAATGLTGAALGIGGGSARTIFGRVRPSASNFAGGFFSYGTASNNSSVTIRRNGGSNYYQLDMGFADINTANGAVAAGAVSTFVMTYSGGVAKLYHNGALVGSLSRTLTTGTDAAFQIGRYVYGNSTPNNDFAWHGQVYEVGAVAGVAWSDAEVAAYDAAPLGMLRTAEPTDHALTAAAITTGAPAPGAPAVAQNHQLAGAGLTTGAPAPARPTVAQAHTVTAQAVETGAPSPGRPVFDQLHQLAAAAVVAGVAVLGAPALTITNHALAATPIETGAPVLGVASMAGDDAVVAPSLLTGPAALGRPAITQAHALQAVGVTAQAPDLGAPAVAQTYQLAAADRVTGAPAPGRPALAQLHTLDASNLQTGAPQLPAPGFSGGGAFLATTITTAAPTIERAALTQNHVAVVAPIGVSAPALGRPALEQFHTLAAADRVTGAPALGRPSINFEQGLGGFMFVSLDEAKRHLRVDYDDDDSDISIKLLAAEEAVSDYIGRPIPWLDGNGVEVPAPAAIRAATLLYLGDLFSNRLGVTEARLSDNPTALRLLQRHRSFGEP